MFSMGGQTTKNLKGYLPGCVMVWFHPLGIKNVISISKLTDKYRVAYENTGENKFLVYLTRGEVRSLKQCDRGLFYSDMSAGQGTVLLNTVEQNKYKYSQSNYTRDLMACKLQYKIDLPSHRHLGKILEKKVQMLNFPLNWDDVRGAE